jgi:hypothetical protein
LQGPRGFEPGESGGTCLMQSIHHLAKYVDLQLCIGFIADAHRFGIFIS